MSNFELEGEIHYKKFMADACRLLEKGDVAYCYYEYQVNSLRKTYKSKLEVRYDERYEWWTCRLKKKK